MAQREVLLTDLIDDFVGMVERREPYLAISRKFNCLGRVLGPFEMQGLREAWAYHDAPNTDALPWAFGDTIDFLHKQCKGVKVYIDC